MLVSESIGKTYLSEDKENIKQPEKFIGTKETRMLNKSFVCTSYNTRLKPQARSQSRSEDTSYNVFVFQVYQRFVSASSDIDTISLSEKASLLTINMT